MNKFLVANGSVCMVKRVRRRAYPRLSTWRCVAKLDKYKVNPLVEQLALVLRVNTTLANRNVYRYIERIRLYVPHMPIVVCNDCKCYAKEKSGLNFASIYLANLVDK